MMSGHATGSERRVPSTLLGMILFISSEVMFFGSLFGAYFTIRGNAGAWPPGGTPELDALRTGLFSIPLLASSVTQQLGLLALKKQDSRGLIRWTVITILLGAIFLLNQGVEYAQLSSEGFTVSTNVFATLFFTMTGFHGLHVFAGLVVLGLIVSKARRGHFSAQRHGPAEAAGYYWHFVDVVWIFLFSVLYLLQ